ncbi:MAG: hypothetical protein MUC56_04110 [Thermoanaerobaculales bacterium]|jgi:hypothetical protein|nr:hypothetical protein [Thermoanaerobaculales bacterium]
MRRLITALFVLVLVAAAAPSFALLGGTDIIVPAAGRGAPWGTDLYIANPGDTTVTGSVYWLVRGQANPNPISVAFTLAPGETAVFTDIINASFGLTTGNGAFRVTASDVVVVNSRIFASDGSSTFGQGFEGVPTTAATQTGGTATVVGLSYNSAFRTNVYATAGAAGATASASLLDPEGNSIATANLTLGAWEPYLRRVDQLFTGVANFDDATLSVEITAGSAVFGASKVDNASTDPTTLESDATTAGSGSVDGTYQISIYDSAFFAAGGNIVIDSGVVTQINGTYFNWDKLSGGEPACTLQFLWGIGMSPTPLADFASGVTFSDSYTSTGSGVMEWTVTFTVSANMAIEGTVAAVGSDFTAPDELGCNGAFPALVMSGGKTE